MTVLLTVSKLYDTANTVMQLGILKIESVKPIDKPQKLVDGNGLYLYVPAAPKSKASGASTTPRQVTRSWRYNFRFGNKRYTLTFGPYPILGLADARDLLRDAKRQLALGINPALEKQVQRIVRQTAVGDTFEAIADD